MLYPLSPPAVALFLVFVVAILAVSFFIRRRAASATAVPWFVNGIAFAGDYLSAAFFLGICGAIAFAGYDGFLYAIGAFAGLVVAFFLIAEPLRRHGAFTLADTLASRFGSHGHGGIGLAAALSTLVVSLFFLVPELVGAGAVLKPLFGFSFAFGVSAAGVLLILLCLSAGIMSTVWEQFIKGSLLILCVVLITILVLLRGLTTKPAAFPRTLSSADFNSQLASTDTVLRNSGPWAKTHYARVRHADGSLSVWTFTGMERLEVSWPAATFTECQLLTETPTGTILINGLPQSSANDLHPAGVVQRLPDAQARGALGPLSFLSTLEKSDLGLPTSQTITDDTGKNIIYSTTVTSGADVLAPGNDPALFPGLKSKTTSDRLNFISLMLALFFGAAALPHLFRRSSAVEDHTFRKSTFLGIVAVGLLFILTLYLGLGAMTSNFLDPTNSNLAAPLLAKSFGNLLFAFFSAIAFTTILSTASILILNASRAAISLLTQNADSNPSARTAKIAAIVITLIAIPLGILFQKMNIAFLVAWAFTVAASANLPAVTMPLFWRRTTRQGITASILVGLVSSLTWMLLSPDAYATLYHLPAAHSPLTFNEPALVTIPLAFVTLILVSLATNKMDRITLVTGTD